MALTKEHKATNKTVVLIVTSIAAFIMPFSMASVNVALPTISNEFSLNAVLLSWIVTANTLATGIALVPTGRLADIYGRRKFFIYGTIVQFVSFLIAALAPSYTVLIIARVFQGIGTGMAAATYPAILVSVYPANERGKVLGINVAAVYAGLSLAPVIGGLMTQYLGWRSIFYMCALFALVIITAVILKIKDEWTEAKGEKFDIIGSIIFGVALIAIVYGISILPEVSGIVILLAGLVLLILFVLWELKVRSPVIDINLFRHNRVFAFSNIATLLNYMAIFAILMLLSLYLQYIKGFDPSYTGMLLLFQPAVQVVIAPLAGRLSDKVRPQYISSAGMVLTTIGLGMFAMLNSNTSIIYIIISQIVIGLGAGAFASPNSNAIISSVDKKYYGVANAVIGTMRTMGQMLSLGIITLLFTIFIGHQQITVEYYPAFLLSIRVIFIVSAVLCIGGIISSLISSKKVTSNH
ncbi:MAG: MFS transporter [Dehalococcoidales bacterium]|nr:MFS transporter [Dehalococcoidales bacterium]